MTEINVELLNEYCSAYNNWGRWGDDDELGTMNFVTPEKIKESASMVKQGKVFSLQLPLDNNGPQTGAFGRVNSIHQMVATGTDYVEGTQGYPLEFGFADDTVFLFLQGGTQWDALSHIFHNGKMFNGYNANLVTSRVPRRTGSNNKRQSFRAASSSTSPVPAASSTSSRAKRSPQKISTWHVNTMASRSEPATWC